MGRKEEPQLGPRMLHPMFDVPKSAVLCPGCGIDLFECALPYQDCPNCGLRIAAEIAVDAERMKGEK